MPVRFRIQPETPALVEFLLAGFHPGGIDQVTLQPCRPEGAVGAQIGGFGHESHREFPQDLDSELFGGQAKTAPQRSRALDREFTAGDGSGDRSVPGERERFAGDLNDSGIQKPLRRGGIIQRASQ